MIRSIIIVYRIAKAPVGKPGAFLFGKATLCCVPNAGKAAVAHYLAFLSEVVSKEGE